jgi:ankyrin repeat protein
MKHWIISVLLCLGMVFSITACNTLPKTQQMKPIHSSALVGDMQTVRKLVGDGENVNSPNSLGGRYLGYTPLHLAIENGHVKLAEYLIEKGADVNVAAKNGLTPLHIAAFNGLSDLVGLLIEKGAIVNVSTTNGLSPLHMAAIAVRNNESVMRELLENGANVNIGIGSGIGTPLIHAAKFDDRDVASYLIKNGADVNATDAAGATALHLSAKFGSVNYISVLLAHNADVNAKRKNKETPLHWAAINGRTMIAEMLINKGAQTEVETSKGSTPLDYAEKSKNETTIALLQKYNNKAEAIKEYPSKRNYSE